MNSLLAHHHSPKRCDPENTFVVDRIVDAKEAVTIAIGELQMQVTYKLGAFMPDMVSIAVALLMHRNIAIAGFKYPKQPVTLS